MALKSLCSSCAGSKSLNRPGNIMISAESGNHHERKPEIHHRKIESCDAQLARGGRRLVRIAEALQCRGRALPDEAPRSPGAGLRAHPATVRYRRRASFGGADAKPGRA